MMDNINSQIINIKLEIDSIKEYLHTDVCRKCAELSIRLEECELLLQQYLNKNHS